MPIIAQRLVQAKIKHFDLEKKDLALAWLEQTDDRSEPDAYLDR
jgi:hypothetical protein